MPRTRIATYLFFLAILAPSSWTSGLARAQNPAPDFGTLSRQANAERLQGESSNAIRDYETALKLHPQWPEGWWYLGTLYADSGRFADAIDVFRKLTDANPKLGPAWASLGLSEFELKDYKNSLRHLQQAQEHGFAEVPYVEKPAAYHLALLLNLNGEFEDAFGLLASEFGKEAITQQTRLALAMSLLRIPLLPDQLDPGKDALIADAGDVAELLVTANFEQAFHSFRQMLQDYPNTPYLHYAYGSALDFNSRYEEAESELREETRVTPQNPLPQMRLAAIALKTHRPEDALSLAQRSLELGPQSATAHRIAAKGLAELGKTEASALETAAADKLEPEKPYVDATVASAYANRLTPINNSFNNSFSKASHSAASSDFEELSRSAVNAAQQGRTDEAITHYEDALRIRPQWDEGWAQLGTLAYIKGRYDDGISASKNALSIAPRRAEAWVFLGLCEFEAEEYKNAYLHLEHGRELGFHGTPEAQNIASIRLAELRSWNGDFDGAKDLLIPQIDRKQLTPTGETILGLTLLRMPLLVAQLDPSRQSLVHAAGKTATLLYAERYNEAFESFQRMLKDYPNTPFLHYAYGSALESLSEHDEAEAQLRAEIQIAPDNALPYARMADIFLKTGRLDDAVSAAEKAVQLDPQAPGGHELLGRALLETGKTDRAIKELEIAGHLAPNYPEVHFNLARAYTKARMTADAERERSIFARLSEAEESQKSSETKPRTLVTPLDRKSSSPATPKAQSSDPMR